MPSKHTKIIPVVSVTGLPPCITNASKYVNFLDLLTSIQAGNTACNYRTHYHLVLSHKTYQNQGICYVTIAYCYITKTFVARNKFTHVKVARNTKKLSRPAVGKRVAVVSSKSGVPNLGFMYPQGYICLSLGVRSRLSIEEQNIFAYNFFPNISAYISEYYFQKSLYTC